MSSKKTMSKANSQKQEKQKISEIDTKDTFNEFKEFDAVAEEYKNIEGLIKEPATQQDIEHNAYLRLMHEYHNFVNKRKKCREVGIFVIVSLAILFLILMFSVDSKIIFLSLWVISIFISVFVIIRIDYRCYKYAIILGIDDNENNN